jgi:hypothetical protein
VQWPGTLNVKRFSRPKLLLWAQDFFRLRYAVRQFDAGKMTLWVRNDRLVVPLSCPLVPR